MDIRNLRTFIRVAELNNFTKAAQSMGYSQSAVTVQMQQLENELGIPLFDRIGKNIKLNQYGLNFVDYAIRVIEAMEKAENFATDSRHMKGYIRFGIVDSILNACFISILPESMGPHLVFILALLAFPLGMVMGSDPIYYVIAPVMAQVIPQYGGTNYQLAAALIVGTCCSMMVCPVGPTPYLALGMVDESMQSHMKYSVPWMFLFAVVMAFCMGVFGIIKF